MDLTLSSLQTFMAKRDKTLFGASEGQAHHSSRLNHILYANNRSFVTRLTTRSLSGPSLRIQVHHHLGFRLHLIWHCRREKSKKRKLPIRWEKCIERKFLTDDNIENFCYELERNTLEGLNSCVCELGLVPFSEEKVHPCYKRPSFPSQLDEITTPTWYINLIQERDYELRCTCHVHESPMAIQRDRIDR